MGSETTPKLPVIDCNGLDLEAKNRKWEEVKSQVFKAFKEYGAFEAVFDEVPLELRKSLVGALKELFDLPYETKIKNVCEIPFFGYLGKDPSRRALYESIGIDEPQILENVESMEKILCPEGYPSFSKVVHAFSEKLSELEKIFRKMVVESLGVEKYLDEHMDISSYILRVIKYSIPQADDVPLGVSPHTDAGFLTVLYQDEIQGLEIQTKDGNWIKASPHSIVVILSDSFHVWSNGRLDATLHRVIVSGNEERYSTALFSKPKTGYIVKAPEELVDEEHPLRYKPFDMIKFLDYFYYNDDSRKHINPLKAYCGV